MYEDDSLLAGEDINNQWHMYNYCGGKNINCSGMYLSGSATVLIAHAKSDGVYQIQTAFEGISGRFKIVPRLYPIYPPTRALKESHPARRTSYFPQPSPPCPSQNLLPLSGTWQ